MNRCLVLAFLMSFVVVAVLSCSQTSDEAKPPTINVDKHGDDTLVKEIEPQDVPYKGDKEDRETLVKGNNEFAFDLYARLSQKEGNIIFSPYSISTALAMTYGGARGKTAHEMAKTLHFTLPQQRLHPAFAELMAALQKEDKRRFYDLHTANALWGQKDFGFKDEFLQLTRKNYRAGFKEVDFLQPEEARQIINRWVAEQTEDKIKELLEEGKVNQFTRLVLTNAIYFKATWQMPFPKDKTRNADFEVTPTEKVSVPMMVSELEVFNFYAGDEFQWLELPYLGDRLVMVVLLPQKKGELASLGKSLTTATLRKGLGKLKPYMGKVALPRFQLNTYYHLAIDLKEMGMPLAFSDGADFSGIAPGLRITFVEHKAYIVVDEVGTEAAAATAVGLGASAPPPFSFRADHPFVFLIRDRQTDSILFLGRVTNPKYR